MKFLFGLGMIVLGAVQLYLSKDYIKALFKDGFRSSTIFAPIAAISSLIIGAVFIVVGALLIFNRDVSFFI